LIGGAVGFLASKLERIAAAVVSGWCGLALGWFIVNTWVQADSIVLQWTIDAFLMFLFGVLALIWHN